MDNNVTNGRHFQGVCFIRLTTKVDKRVVENCFYLGRSLLRKLL